MKICEMTISDFELIKNNLKSDFDDFWNENILKQEILNKNHKYFSSKENEEILGFAGISIVLDEAEIMNIVVKKDKRKNGIGKALIKRIIEFCKENKIKVLKLEANEKNIPALNLYNSVGFKKVGVRKNYYKNDSAILMDLKIY